jgi:quercetin dioxygenase-like cupin family protein
MKTWDLAAGLEFHEDNPYAQPLHADRHGRILRFTLRAGQRVVEHNAPHSPVNVIVLQGQGTFSGGDGQAITAGPGTLLLFEPGENHAISTDDDDLVFLVILHGAPTPQS